MDFPEYILQTYDIEGMIGQGGGGVVFLATHRRLQKKVVLKKIKEEIVNFINCRAEVDILKKIRHAYLPQVIDFIESPEGIFTVMDYIEGESLQQKLDRGYKFSEEAVRKYTEQLCEAVECLHSQNPPIIHGDIKPDNVMITDEGNVCLIDFNVSGFLNGASLKTIGYTPGYSSPEQTLVSDQLNVQVDMRSDIYSIGATAYAIIGGDVKYLKNGKLPRIPSSVSDGMRILLLKSLESKPERRYQSVSGMLKALRQIQKLDVVYYALIRTQHFKFFFYSFTVFVSAILLIIGYKKFGPGVQYFEAIVEAAKQIVNGRFASENLMLTVGSALMLAGIIQLARLCVTFRIRRKNVFKAIREE